MSRAATACRGASGSRARSTAASRKLARSVTVSAVIPPAAASTPPAAEPASRDTSPTWPLSALAVTRWSSATSTGMTDCWAGVKNCCTQLSAATTR